MCYCRSLKVIQWKSVGVLSVTVNKVMEVHNFVLDVCTFLRLKTLCVILLHEMELFVTGVGVPGSSLLFRGLVQRGEDSRGNCCFSWDVLGIKYLLRP